MVAFSCALILVIYTVIFGIGIRYLLAMMAYPPSLSEQPPANDPPQRSQGITPGLAGGQGEAARDAAGRYRGSARGMIAMLAGQPVLPVIWACIMAFVILAYVVLDGFDLGVGMLFATEHDEHDRDVMVNTIAPVWDGNETWLVLGGSGLYGAFPTAYSVILPAIYPLVFVMLMGLILRGVAFEFRFRAIPSQRHWWDWAFLGGSVLAGFCQGAILGALIQGNQGRERPVRRWPARLAVALHRLLRHRRRLWLCPTGVELAAVADHRPAARQICGATPSCWGSSCW